METHDPRLAAQAGRVIRLEAGQVDGGPDRRRRRGRRESPGERPVALAYIAREPVRDLQAE
jgi:hypothetical protein